jgi:hypothetical protein
VDLTADAGIVLLTVEQLERRVRADFDRTDRDLIGELMAERRTAATLDDA